MNEAVRSVFKRDFDEAEKIGINKEKERVATDMLMDGKPLYEIKRYSKLAEDTIRNLAQTLGITIL